MLSKEVEVHLILSDTPANDWRTAFGNANKLLSCGNLTFCGVGRNFYGKLVPENHLDIVVTSTSLHWTSRMPESKFYWANGKSRMDDPKVKEKQYELSLKDFKSFLDARAIEIKSDGFLLISMPVKNDKGRSYEFLEILDVAIESMVKQGKIGSGFAQKYTFPVVHVSVDKVKQIILNKADDWKVMNWQLEHHEFPASSAYSLNGDIDAYGKEMANFVKGAFFPYVKALSY